MSLAKLDNSPTICTYDKSTRNSRRICTYRQGSPQVPQNQHLQETGGWGGCKRPFHRKLTITVAGDSYRMESYEEGWLNC